MSTKDERLTKAIDAIRAREERKRPKPAKQPKPAEPRDEPEPVEVIDEPEVVE